MKHTSTPWKASKDGATILDSNNFSLATADSAYGVLEGWDKIASHWSRYKGITCIDLDEETTQANAEFIVRACNNFDALVEALGNLVNNFSDSSTTLMSEKKKALEQANSALKQARETNSEPDTYYKDNSISSVSGVGIQTPKG